MTGEIPRQDSGPLAEKSLSLGLSKEYLIVNPEDFAREQIKDLSTPLQRYSLVENSNMGRLEVNEALENATTTEQAASVLGEAIILDDPNLAEGIRASMNLRDDYLKEAIFVGAVASAKAEMLEKGGISAKAKAKLQSFKDDVLYFFTDKASTPRQTWKRSRLGEARAKFLKNTALTVAALTLAACGARGVDAATDTAPIPGHSTSSGQATETLPATEAVEQAAFPEELKQELSDWVGRQQYGTEYLPSLIQYSQLLVEANQSGGWDVSVERVDWQKDLMFTLQGLALQFTVDGEAKEIDVDRLIAETEPDEGGYIRLRISEGGENDPAYMWRYPWGGWVTDAYKTFTENGVSIIANEAELYGGLFTINPEQVEEYWEDTVRSIYYIQAITENAAITSKYPTVEGFLEAARSGQEFESLRILVGYPDNTRRQKYSGTWQEIGVVSLQAVSYTIPQLTAEEIIDYSTNERDYLHYEGADGSIKMERISVEGNNILSFQMRRAIISDDMENNDLSLVDSKDADGNYPAATQLIKTFTVKVDGLYKMWRNRPTDVYQLDFQYPRVNTLAYIVSESEAKTLQETDGSLLFPRP